MAEPQNSYKVFYSWQKERPETKRTNYALIGEALNDAIKLLKQDGHVIEADRDTKDEAGMVDIAATIFKKIDECTVFLADVSITNRGSFYEDAEGHRRPARPSPNPNVLVETGYALKSLGATSTGQEPDVAGAHESENTVNRLVCVFNCAFGGVEELPFDLRHRRILQYTADPNTSDLKAIKKQLVTDLRNSIEKILTKMALPSNAGEMARVETITEPLFKWLDSVGVAKRKPLLACAAVPIGPLEIPEEQLEGLAGNAYVENSTIGEIGKFCEPKRLNAAIHFNSADTSDEPPFRYWRLTTKGVFLCAVNGLDVTLPSTLQALQHEPQFFRYLSLERIVKRILEIEDHLDKLKTELAARKLPIRGFTVRIRISNEIRNLSLESTTGSGHPRLGKNKANVDPVWLPLTVVEKGDISSNLNKLLWKFHHPPILPERVEEIRQSGEA